LLVVLLLRDSIAGVFSLLRVVLVLWCSLVRVSSSLRVALLVGLASVGVPPSLLIALLPRGFIVRASSLLLFRGLLLVSLLGLALFLALLRAAFAPSPNAAAAVALVSGIPFADVR